MACIEAATNAGAWSWSSPVAVIPARSDYALYVLVKDSAGNLRRGAQAPISALARGEGMTLAEVALELLS